MRDFLCAVELEAAFCMGMGYLQSPIATKDGASLVQRVRSAWLGKYLVEVEAMRMGISASRLRAMRAASRRKPSRTPRRGMLL
jgi:hypothetical protein